jgi:hypothetical protein
LSTRWLLSTFAVKAGCSWPDVDVIDALIEDMLVKRRLELGAIIGLDHLNLEGKFFSSRGQRT